MDVVKMNQALGFTEVEFRKSPFVTDLPPQVREASAGKKGYMASGFFDVPLLVAIKPDA
jgi:uncharacterized protein YebE (UPF0316 family)